jgi:hypothetical protein
LYIYWEGFFIDDICSILTQARIMAASGVHSERFTITISDKIGEVSAILQVPQDQKALLVLAHGAGANMEHSFMADLADNLATKGIGTLRFNFPYMEKGKFRPDTPAVAHETIACLIKKAHELYPAVPLLAGGKSFGGRMTSQYLAKTPVAFVKGIVFYGFPLHPDGKPSIERAEHLKDIRIPMLFLQGTRDALAELPLIEGVCGSLPTATLVKISGADHAFKITKKDKPLDLAAETFAWFQAI